MDENFPLKPAASSLIKRLSIALISALAVLIIGIFIYYRYNSINSQIYRDNKHGFEFEYPNDYTLTIDNRVLTLKNNYSNSADITIALHDNSAGQTVLEYVESLNKTKPSEYELASPAIFSFSTTTINNIPAVDIKAGTEGCADLREVYLQIPDKFIRYYYCKDIDYAFEDSSHFEKYLESGDEILSTFKFTAE